MALCHTCGHRWQTIKRDPIIELAERLSADLEQSLNPKNEEGA
jgi:hypothetical protein